eukprot:scaffold68110_cov23-Prasinocladus_malaysianus.AAC.1
MENNDDSISHDNINDKRSWHAFADEKVQDWDDIPLVSRQGAPELLHLVWKLGAVLPGDIVEALEQGVGPRVLTA